MNFNGWYIILARDLFELLVLAILCYYWLLWLRLDRQKPLMRYFLLYLFCWAFCFVMPLPALLALFESSSSIIIMLFLLMHQKTLQKNGIALFKIAPTEKSNDDWKEQLIRFCLQAETDLQFLCEHTQSLVDLLDIAIKIESHIDTHTLSYLTGTKQFDHTAYLLITSQGQLLGLNATWHHAIALEEIEQNLMLKSSYYIQQLDAFAIHYKASERTFYLIIQEHIFGPLTAHQLRLSLEKYLKSTVTYKGVDNEPFKQASQQQQPHA